jgi:hypothetical protein
MQDAPIVDREQTVVVASAPIWSTGGFLRAQSGRDLDLIAHAPDDLTRTTNALRGVLELHKPEAYEDEPAISFCTACQRDQLNGIYPCPTVHTITEALQGEQ